MSLSRPILLVAAIPAIWMLVQVLPLQRLGLAHSIWESATLALGRPIAGRISIDPGVTVISLTRYLSAILITLLAAALSFDRRRAEVISLTLVTATALIATLIVVTDVGDFAVLPYRDGAFST